MHLRGGGVRMKKIITFWVMLLLSLSLVSAQTTCYDNDDGKQFDAKGKVTLNALTEPKSYTDFCLSRKILVEMFCENDALSSIRVQCDCRGGACR